jgi:hypothetical protein
MALLLEGTDSRNKCTRPQTWNSHLHGEAPDGPLCTSARYCSLACTLQLTTPSILSVIDCTPSSDCPSRLTLSRSCDPSTVAQCLANLDLLPATSRQTIGFANGRH